MFIRREILRCLIALFCLAFFSTYTGIAFSSETVTATKVPPAAIATAQDKAADDKQQSENLLANAIGSGIQGPVQIPLVDEANLDLPADYIFIASEDAQQVMRLLGNEPRPELVGIIASKDKNFTWYITLSFMKSGYVSDVDAEMLDSEFILNSIKNNIEKQNIINKALKLPLIIIQGWIQPPNYDSSTHVLYWSLLLGDGTKDSIVNYYADVLGREGYFLVELVSLNSEINKNSFHLNNIVKAINYNSSYGYDEYVEGTNSVAEGNLTALVGAPLTEKIGLLNFLALIWTKGWKFIVFLPLLIPLIFLTRIIKWLNKLFS